MEQIQSMEYTRLQKLIEVTSSLIKVKQQLLSLLSEEFKEEFEREAYISGGCIYSLYRNQEPKDYDFFLKSNSLAPKLRDYFIDVAGYKGRTVSGGLYKSLPLVITDNAISIGKYQIITRWVGTPKEVIEQFDFKHLMFYFEKEKIDTYSDLDFLDSSDLAYNEKRARDIVGTIIRTNKFIQRGMTIPHKEMSKILLKLHEVGFNERELELLRESSSDEHFGS